MESISKRAQEIINRPSVIVDAAIKCGMDPYSESNQNGYLNFGVAENHLIDDLIYEKTKSFELKETAYHHYNRLNGCEPLRKAFVNYLEKFFLAGSRKLNDEGVSCASGASAILEIISYALFDEGDEIVTPSPYYSGFEHDLELRFKTKLVPFPMQMNEADTNDPCALISFLKVRKPKGLLLCHPHNPTGKVYSEAFIKKIIQFCEEFKIHLIVDEVYFMTKMKEQKLVTSLSYSKDFQYVHFVYSMAKDFALGGFKHGFFYTENSIVAQAVGSLCYFYTPATHTQLLIADMFNDHDWIERYQTENTKRLNQCFERIQKGFLDIHCDHYTMPENGFFSFINLKSLMQKKKIANDVQMFEWMINDLKINMLPDNFFGYPDKGYFRLCFARENKMIDELIKRFNQI